MLKETPYSKYEDIHNFKIVLSVEPEKADCHEAPGNQCGGIIQISLDLFISSCQLLHFASNLVQPRNRAIKETMACLDKSSISLVLKPCKETWG